jgi:hypothetical protein
LRAGYQWRLNNVDIPGASGAADVVASAREHDAGLYTVAIRLASEDVVASTPFAVTLGACPWPDMPPVEGKWGGGVPSAWCLGLLLLAPRSAGGNAQASILNRASCGPGMVMAMTVAVGSSGAAQWVFARATNLKPRARSWRVRP